jgi:antitoxin component of MazEF toxin-antitoxin module
MLVGNEQRAQADIDATRERQHARLSYCLKRDDSFCRLRSPPSGGQVMETPQLLSVNRVRLWGGSHVVSLSKEVRAAMGIKGGDTVAFRKVGRYVFLAVVRAFAVAPVTREEIQQARAVQGG